MVDCSSVCTSHCALLVFAGLMDFICFAARLKCYYEGGVGLQKTLNHAGTKKRASGMSMPGDSDSDDDDDSEV